MDSKSKTTAGPAITKAGWRIHTKLGATILLFSLLILGAVRPFFPQLYELGHGSDFAAWNMYKDKVWSDTDTYLYASDTNERIEFRPGRYLWHNPLVDTKHGNIRPSTVQAFADHLAGQQELRDRARLKNKNVNWTVVVQLRYWRNNIQEATISAEANIQ